ncbi:MAG: Rpn family recombination-promoting nuclease/putative transposase [Lachnospiraceae bacterium]|nr:Rpn family recombination-promoting nuclease/putative transposase [Lachnospiraceae bacterium]
MEDMELQLTEEKLEELRVLVSKLRLIDDTFFEKVMEDRETCEEVVRVIMEDPGLSIKAVKPQESVHNLQGRSVRLDALCEKSDGNYINVEIQRANNDNHFKRVRYNAACITANVTDPGEQFKNVRDVCVIYISEFDIFKRGKTIYHVRHVVQETENEENPIYVDDGFTSIYVNTAINDNTEIAELMNCFLQTKVNNPKFPKLSKRVTQFKESAEGVKEMCAIVEEYAKSYAEEYVKSYAKEYADKREAKGKKEGIEQGKKEGMEIGSAKTIIQMSRKFNLTDGDICKELQDALKISHQEAEKYMELFGANEGE